MCNRTQNDATWGLIALFLTNQIVGNIIDFKMNVIKAVTYRIKITSSDDSHIWAFRFKNVTTIKKNIYIYIYINCLDHRDQLKEEYIHTRLLFVTLLEEAISKYCLILPYYPANTNIKNRLCWKFRHLRKKSRTLQKSKTFIQNVEELDRGSFGISQFSDFPSPFFQAKMQLCMTKL